MGLVNSLIRISHKSQVKIEFVFDQKVNAREKLGNPNLESVPKENLFLARTAYISGIIKFQSWLGKALKSDVVIIENCVNNLTNIAFLLINLISRKSVIVLGHDDFSFYNKRPLSGLKSLLWNKLADGFLFYTFWEAQADKAIKLKRDFYNNFNDEVLLEKVKSRFVERANIKSELGIPPNRRVVLYVGRMDKTKGFDESWCQHMAKLGEEANLYFFFVGFSESEFPYAHYFTSQSVRYIDFVSDSSLLSDYFAIADVYIHPGTIGLGPIRAIQHGLKPICFGLKKHNPEVAYCDSRNTIFINQTQDFDWAVSDALESSAKWSSRQKVINSISWLNNDTSANRIIDFIHQFDART
jgi:glycosyltransferase involved in cell wall biosynthesis